MNYGKILKTGNGYIISEGLPVPYEVVPKDLDPYGRFDFEDVKAYAEANPDMVVSEEEDSRRTSLLTELSSLKQYLTDTDWCVIKCMELGRVMAEAYPDIHDKRTEARLRINEVEALLSEQEDVVESECLKEGSQEEADEAGSD